MRPSVRSVLLFSIATLALGTGAAAADYSPATNEMAQWGVEGYTSESTGAKTLVEYFGIGGELMATVRIHFTDSGAINLRIQSPETAGRQLFLSWDETRGLLSFNHPSWPRTLGAFFDLQAFSWKADPDLEQLTARFSQEIALAALALDRSKERPDRIPIHKAASCASAGLSIPGLEPKSWLYCNGSGYCRGFGSSDAASSCCEEAAQDANNCCTNSICWGCCRLATCDKKCFMGDYFCFCGVTGYSCKYPDY